MSTGLLIVVALQFFTLIAVAILYLRKPAGASQDPRLALIPDTLIRHETRLQALDENLRSGLDSLNSALRADLAVHRSEAASHALSTREGHDRTSQHLREELTASVARLSGVLLSGLESFRTDNRAADEALKSAVAHDLNSIGQRLANFINEANRAQIEARESLHTRLTALNEANVAHQEKLRATVGDSLAKIQYRQHGQA